MAGSVFNWLFRIAAGVFALAVCLVGLAFYFAQRSLPDYSDQLEVQGLAAPVEIVRNNSNVPHIFAASDTDAYFGLGFSHAQDRLWQMITLRRTAQGRLSELFGTATVDIDSFVRRLDLYGLAVASVQHQTLEATRMLEAYAAGVNARIAQINARALGRGAPEMWVFGHAVAPWRPADSIALAKLMGLQLSGHLDDEVLLARTALTLPDPARIDDILPVTPGPGLAALEDYAALEIPAREARQARLDHPLSPFPPPGLAGASNVFAAAPHRSAAGGTLLANDPHLGLTAPAIWYLARLDLQSGGVIGATIPGIPVVLSGRSDRLGWGVASAYVDDQDIVLEEISPEDPELYLTAEGWRRFESRPSIITIAGADPVTLTLRWSQTGPILPGAIKSLSEVTPAGHVVALNWTVLSPQDTSLSAAERLMRAGTVAEGLAAMESYIAPAQNLTLVDRQTIALKTVGAIPKRDPNHRTQGRLPAYGRFAENRWQGRMPYASNPEFVAPAGGILGNTNNKIVDRPFPDHVSFSFGDTQRVNRWQRLMQTRQVHTRDSFIEAQLDTVSPTARTLLPLIGADLWFNEPPSPQGTRARQRARALALLAEWNGEMNEHWPEPLLYAAWVRALQNRLIRDEMGPLAAEFTSLHPLFIERVYRDIDGASAWCDVIQSAPVETCTDMARLALDDALLWVEERWGRQIEALRWGSAHQASHDHPILGEVPILSYFVNIRQSTSGGDNTLMRGRTKGTGPNPFLNVHGAGYRGVYDFGDPDSSVFVISTGQSGHPLSRHYDDLSQLWRRGEYIPMSLDPDLARAGAVGITVLNPAASGE